MGAAYVGVIAKMPCKVPIPEVLGGSTFRVVDDGNKSGWEFVGEIQRIHRGVGTTEESWLE